MATIQVRLDLKLDEVTAKARVNVDRAVKKAAHDTEAIAKNNAPVETGNLRLSIQAKELGEAWWTVESPVKYSVYVEYGTSAHIIPVHRDPETNKFSSNPDHPLELINHPGTPAKPYMHPAVEVVKPTLMLALQKAVQ